MPYYVYVMSNRTHVLYIGFTNDLTRRVTEHQAGLIAGFTQTYHLKRLVYFEVVRKRERSNRAREATQRMAKSEEDHAN